MHGLERMDVRSGSDWFGHPRGLTVLFLTEMWEKFSYYGMRALLVYYMTKHLLLAQAQASLVYGAYTAFAYFTPIVGGWFSDRWLGRRKAVVIGGTIMALGHFMMAFESLFYPALATIALGNGLYLPSLPSQIQGLYAPGDPRGKSAYNVYYVGVNLGGFMAPLICGLLGELYGWHWGFGAAGVGMVCGLLIYMWGSRWLPANGPTVTRVASDGPAGSARLYLLLAGIVLVVVVFRGAYEQLGNTVALWADVGVNRSIGNSLSIPMTWFQAVNPLLVMVLTPLLLARWRRLSQQGREISSVGKMARGAGIVAIAYVLLAVAAAWSTKQAEPASWVWLVAFLVVLTVGELYVLPVGLGLFGRLAPPQVAATVIAGWFFATFAGSLLGGALGTFWSRLSATEFFGLMAAVSAVGGVLLMLFDRPIRDLESK